DRGIKAVIPEPRDQQQHRRNRGSHGGRPVGLDVEAYRGRNVIERGYSDVKQWRGLATRYDKLGLTYRAGAVLRAIIQWLNHLLSRHALGHVWRRRIDAFAIHQSRKTHCFAAWADLRRKSRTSRSARLEAPHRIPSDSGARRPRWDPHCAKTWLTTMWR